MLSENILKGRLIRYVDCNPPCLFATTLCDMFTIIPSNQLFKYDTGVFAIDDPITGDILYFHSSVIHILQAFYHYNRNYCLVGGFNDCKNLFEFLGLPIEDGLDDFGFQSGYTDDGWVDFKLIPVMLNGTIPAAYIEIPFGPVSFKDINGESTKYEAYDDVPFKNNESIAE